MFMIWLCFVFKHCDQLFCFLTDISFQSMQHNKIIKQMLTFCNDCYSTRKWKMQKRTESQPERRREDKRMRIQKRPVVWGRSSRTKGKTEWYGTLVFYIDIRCKLWMMIIEGLKDVFLVVLINMYIEQRKCCLLIYHYAK